MKLEITNLKIDGDKDEVTVVTEFVGKLSELKDGRYGYSSVLNDIQNRIAYSVTNEIIKTRSAEIVKAVDVEEIVARVKLQTIDTILGRERR